MIRFLAMGRWAFPMALTICILATGLALAPNRWPAWLTACALLWSCAILRFWFAARASRSAAPTAADQRGDALAPIYRSTIEALASAIAAKDSYFPHHVARMQHICELIAGRLGLEPTVTEGFRLAALLHDVGKLGVPDHILLKQGPLDPEEFSKMSNHAAIGAKLLENVDFPWEVAPIVRHHHEKYDGTGYPDHLAGDRIPLGSRIIAVAEVYEALVSRRCYREGWSHAQAIEHIATLSGTHFDPKVVDAFMEMEQQIAELAAWSVPEDDCPDESRRDLAAEEVIAQANRELVSLFEMAQTLSSTLEIDEVLALLAHRNRRLLQAASCAVFLVDESRPRTLVARVAVGRHQEIIKCASALVGKGVTGKVASRQRAHVGAYDPNDLSFADENGVELDLKSCAVAPIVSFGEVLGTINLYDTNSNAFTADDLHLLGLVAHQAALAVKNARAFERVRDSAMRDPVTDLHNGRFLRLSLEQELSRASRQGEPLSILGIDLDNFKAVNDLFGHQMGDRVLKDVADIMRDKLRDYDLVARVGGDEFIIVLPGTPYSEARATADRIQSAVAQYAKDMLNQTHVRLQASVGIATYPSDADDLDTLLARADAEMYRDKRARKQDRLAA